MNSASVDLIYLDPPFNSKANYAAPIGSKAAGAAFKDTWTLTDLDVAWINLIEAKHPALYRVILAAMTDSDKSYLAYMAVRLIEMQRILKPSGSIYLHCDPTMSHYLKLVMDAIFGKAHFRNEIVWHYYNKFGRGTRVFGRNYDQLLMYSGGMKYVFNAQREPRTSPVRQLVRESVGGVLKNKRDADGNVMYRVVNDKKVDAVWSIPCLQPASASYLGYPTQKPLALLDRVIRASSDLGGIVLDPFCGCATACIAAEQNHRQWVGIDISPKAAELVQARMTGELRLFYQGAHRTDIPRRTDMGDLIPYNDPHNKRHLYGEQGGDCAGCATHFELRNLEVDHIVPRAKGGTDHLSNLQLLCGHCNRVKGDRGMEYLRAKLQIAA